VDRPVEPSDQLAKPADHDEPTTGLHFEDIRHLLVVLQALVDKGNTVLVIEHNMDVAKQADWVVDLGPDGGDAGGHVVFAGTPEALADADTPTAVFMREELERHTDEEEVGAKTRTLDLDDLSGDSLDSDDVEEDEEAEPEEA
jgi:excinuclease ABC subunit A